MHAKKRSISNISITLDPLYEDMNKSPTTLFELSTLHYKRIKMNTIHVTGLSIKEDKNSEGKITKVEYSSNINQSTKKVNIGENKWYPYINLAKLSRDFVLLQPEKMNVYRYSQIHISLVHYCLIKEDQNRHGIYLCLVSLC